MDDETVASPVLAVCQGHRCSALLHHQHPDGMERLRGLVRDSHLGVLVSTPCAGACAYGPVVGVGTGRTMHGSMRIALHALLGPVESRHVPDVGAFLESPVALPSHLEPLRLVPVDR